MKLPQFWIFYFLFQLSLQLCSQGCLSCSIDNFCLLCDITNFYYLSEGTCIKQIEQPYCSNIDINGQCLRCYSQYFLDLNSKKCIRISQEDVTFYCQDYGPSQNCIRCQKDYYLNLNKCIVVPNKIEYCSYYAGITTCEQCTQGYLLTFDRKRCVQINDIANCGHYTLLECQQCSQGYILNKNMIIQQYSKLQSNIEKTQIAQQLRILEGDFNNILIDMYQVCQQIEVTNCLQILSYDQCQSCIQGSFLNPQKQCITNPLPAIDNCQIYQNATKCQVCMNGYFIQGSICVEVITIENCQVYDGSKSSSTCLQCNQNYYSTGTQCQQRQNSQNIQNCKQFSIDKDTCQQCIDNYIISSDGLKCFQKISNCETHNQTLSSTQELKCEKCLPGYYPESDFTCIPGSDQNCDIFNQQNICLKCINEYFLNENKNCIPQIIIQNCEQYSTITPNECLFCSNNFQNFKIKKFCKFKAPIDNCVQYDTISVTSRCIQCDQGYVLQNNQCNVIQIPFCAEQIQGICTKCQKGFNLTTNQQQVTCVQPLSFIQANCDATQSDSDINDLYILQDECTQCLSHHYPINFANQNICIKNEELIYFQLPNNQDPNCLKFSNSGICLQCKFGLYLENGRCVTTCQSGVHQIIGYNMIGQTSSIQIELQNFNICVDLFEDMNVFAIGLDSSFENKDELNIIVQCNQQALPLIQLDSTKYTVLQPNQDPNLFVKLPNLKFPEINQCIQVSTLSPIIQNCSYYTQIETSGNYQYRCLKCQHQHTSIITKYKKNNYALENCELNNNCAKDDFSPGLDLIWRKLFSCHKCIDTNKIPVLFIYTIDKYNPLPLYLKNYSLNDIKRNDDESINTNLRCMEFKPENIGYDLEDEGQMKMYQDLPLHCALAVVNLRVTNGDATKNQSVLAKGENEVRLAHYCAACKPGHRAIQMNDIYQSIKIKCEYIDYCQGFDWFNQCSQCQQNYTYEFSNDQIRYDKCIQSNDRNCYAMSQDNICKKCIKGYHLNQDDQCEQIKPVNCQSSDVFSFKKQYNKNDINYALYKSSLGYGCLQCNQGYTSIELNHTQQLHQCILSPYLQQNFNILKDDSNYIKNCLNYGIKEQQIVCFECSSNFALDSLQKKCYQVSLDCEIASANEICQQCKEGFFLVNGQCQKQSIPFCKVSNNTQNFNQPRCVQCEPGYYLNQEQLCQLGEVLNCEIFENYQPKKCKKCLDQYALFQSSLKSYCYRLDQSLRCLDAEIQVDQQYGASLTCTQCIENSDILTTEINLLNASTICMEFQNTTFCEKYSKQQSLQNSTLNCEQCQQGYYLTKELNCARRNYESQLYQCQECNKEQSFLDQFGYCQRNPKGIFNCVEYINIETCSKCQESYYLQNNKCININSEKQIINCKFYLDQNQCEQCNQGYFLVDNKCELVQAQNCLTLETPNKCASCKKSYVLQVNEDKINCVLLNKPNCLEFQQTTDNICLICAPNYYPNIEGNCQLSNLIINNCKQYETDGICKICEQGYTLSIQKNACLNLQQYYTNYDQNCDIYKNQVSCSLCDLGFYFKDGKCTSCKNLGCGICNIQNDDICYVCKPNNYMDQNGKCNLTLTGLIESYIKKLNTILIVFYIIFSNQFF